MFKIDSPNATPDNEFQDKNIEDGQPGTRVSAEWLNAVQRELIAVIEAAGLAPSKLDDSQLLASILVLIDENGGGGGGGGGSPYWINAASTFSTLPSGRPVGAIGLTIDTNILYKFNGSAWVQFYSPAELAAKIASSEKGQPLGVATLDATGRVPTAQLPSWNPWLTGVNYAATGVVSYGTLCIADTSAGAYSLSIPAPSAAFQQVGFVRQGPNNLTVYPPSGSRFHGLALNAGWVFTADNTSALFVWSGTEFVPVFLGSVGGGGGGPTNTDGLPEGSVNLYFTNARVLSVIAGQKNVANGIPGLDASGKLADSVLPDLSITDTFVVGNQAAMLALNAQKGDVAVRTDLNQTFILRVAGAATLANWQLLPTPTGAVLSVAGKTGAVILDKVDVGLSNVDNTSDADKPVSTAQATALNLKLNKSGGTADNLTIADRATFTDLATDPATPGVGYTSVYTKAGVLYKKTPDGSVVSIGSLRVKRDGSASFNALSGYIYNVGVTSGQQDITLPPGTTEAYVEFVGVSELINDIRLVGLIPASGQKIGPCAVNETFYLDYDMANVGLYRSEGDDFWTMLLPSVTINREATSLIEGTVSGDRYPAATVAPGVGLKGERKTQVGAATTTVAADTWTPVTDASISLSTGIWDVGYNGLLEVFQVSASSPSAANAALFLDGVLLEDSISLTYYNGSFATASRTGDMNYVTPKTRVIVTGNQVLTLRIRSSTASTSAYARWNGSTGISSGLTDPDVSQFIWAERV